MDIGPEDFREPVLHKRIRRLVAVPRTTALDDALVHLRHSGAHLALTVDDDGEPVSVLFLEDVIEVLIGEVSDMA